MNSICKFIPVKKDSGDLKTIYFVYETELKKLKQPFLQPIYYIHIATRGNAIYRVEEREYPIKKGDLFFAIPGVQYSLDASEDFAYMYISYMGSRAFEIAEYIGISSQCPVFHGFEHEIDVWRNALIRFNRRNANLLTESVLFHTLSYLTNDSDSNCETCNPGVLESVVNYIDNNFEDPTLTLKKTAEVFAYTDKYLSALFKSGMNITWSKYVNRLRIQKAVELINNGERIVGLIATSCGFSDAMYFSRVFKKQIGVTPKEYIEKALQKYSE